MAYATIPSPNHPLGPCPTPCKHRDCRESRRMVAAVCPHCSKPIGYETRFVQSREGHLEHWACALEAADQVRKDGAR